MIYIKPQQIIQQNKDIELCDGRFHLCSHASLTNRFEYGNNHKCNGKLWNEKKKKIMPASDTAI